LDVYFFVDELHVAVEGMTACATASTRDLPTRAMRMLTPSR